MNTRTSLEAYRLFDPFKFQ